MSLRIHSAMRDILHSRHFGSGVKPAGRAAFTLLELLVVILIIAFLLFLGIGTQQRSRIEMNKARCIVNLRQWGLLVSLYMSDSNGAFPLADPFKDGKSWNHATAPLVALFESKSNDLAWREGKSINGCPSHLDAPRGSYRTRYYSYSINYHLTEPKAKPYVGRMMHLQEASRVILIADAKNHASDVRTGFSLQQPEGLDAVHEGGLNALFADGHVAYLSFLDLASHIAPAQSPDTP